MEKTLRSRAGFSVIEIMITVFIISLIMLLVMSFSRSTVSMSKDSRCSDAAYLSAEEKIAELATKSFHSAPFTDKDTIDNIVLDRSWVIDNSNTIKRAIVTVTYKSLAGASRSITLAGAIN